MIALAPSVESEIRKKRTGYQEGKEKAHKKREEKKTGRKKSEPKKGKQREMEKKKRATQTERGRGGGRRDTNSEISPASP